MYSLARHCTGTNIIIKRLEQVITRIIWRSIWDLGLRVEDVPYTCNYTRNLQPSASSRSLSVSCKSLEALPWPVFVHADRIHRVQGLGFRD